MKQTNLLVLAGGFGTRLRSAVSKVPKPLAPVDDRPFLHYLIQSWIQQGVRELTLLLHHQAELIEAFVARQQSEGLLTGCEVRTLREARPLGTGGAIAHAVRHFGLSGTFLVANADTWLGAGITQVNAADAPAMAVVQVPNTERYGQVEIGRGVVDTVTAFQEKQDSAGAGWINAGLYHLQAELFTQWNGEAFSIERRLFPAMVATGRLRAVPLTTEFIDIGIPDDYHRFCRWIGSRKAGVL